MHYFELHIGDCEAATAHLSATEMGFYSRLQLRYFRTEKPLPVDVQQVCRLVRSASKPERDAVQQVLEEFFELQADGWHHLQWDMAIQAFKDGEPEREAKKANEDTRLKRHRAERAELFRRLNEAGQHAPYNIAIGELRSLVNDLRKEPAATPVPPLPETAPATPATATHTPDPTPVPVPQSSLEDHSEPAGPAQADAFPSEAGEAHPQEQKADVWALGVRLLSKAGKTEKEARPMIGKLRQAFGNDDGALGRAMRDCEAQQVADPLPWLLAASKQAAHRRGSLKAIAPAAEFEVGARP